MKKENENAFKHWINPQIVSAYARGLKKSYRDFDETKFTKLRNQLAPLELRDRVKLIANGLIDHLPPNYPEALAILRRAVEKENLEGFSLWPATEFVQLYGVDHFQASFQAMREWTVKFTAEFAVRPFLIQYPERAMAEMLRAAKDKNVHLRRWASEGSRPRLPWGQRLQALVEDCNPTLPILHQLRFDPELYVRKSVSNHLNDIAKDHPDVVVKTLKAWKQEVPQGYEKEFAFIVRQSLRTLIKQGHPDALKLIGIHHNDPALSVKNLQLLAEKVTVGNHLEFQFNVKNTAATPKPFVVDYAIHHRKANGQLSAKVFKLKSGTIAANADLHVKKKHSFKPVTTRTYYPGEHRIEICLNGVGKKQLPFELVTKSPR